MHLDDFSSAVVYLVAHGDSLGGDPATGKKKQLSSARAGVISAFFAQGNSYAGGPHVCRTRARRGGRRTGRNRYKGLLRARLCNVRWALENAGTLTHGNLGLSRLASIGPTMTFNA